MFNDKGDLKLVLDAYYRDGTVTDVWYDWFCTEKSLPKRGKRLIQILAYFVNHKKISTVDKYVFFKNNAPCSGGTYDQVSICEKNTGDVLYCIQERTTGIEVYSKSDDFYNCAILAL